MIQRLLASVVVLALAAGQADAGLLSLNFHSQTMGSTLGGAPIPDGLDFDVHAIFLDDFDFQSDPGIGLFLVTQIDVKITGIPIPVIFSLFDYGAYVFDPSLALGYVPALAAVGGGGALAPAYSAATPPISGDAPTTTVFRTIWGVLRRRFSFRQSSAISYWIMEPIPSKPLLPQCPSPRHFPCAQSWWVWWG